MLMLIDEPLFSDSRSYRPQQYIQACRITKDGSSFFSVNKIITISSIYNQSEKITLKRKQKPKGTKLLMLKRRLYYFTLLSVPTLKYYISETKFEYKLFKPTLENV
jgi:hypothetical protein